MKGEYVEEKDNNTQNTNTMFAKFSHLPPKFQPQPPPPPHHFPPPHFHPHNHPPFLEESNSTTTPPPSQQLHHHPQQHHQHQQQLSSKKIKTTPPLAHQPTTSNEDGATIEISRRPRGRPPGSKNKPKPPIVITRDPEPAMSPYILELPSGTDIVDSLTHFTRRRGVGLCILTASGAVANVTLKQPPTTTPAGTVTFHGRFDILSLSAVVVVNTIPFHGGSSGGGGFTISLAGPQGKIVGGKVVGTLVCSGTVYVIAASFNNPSYCKLPLADEHQDSQVELQPQQQSRHNTITTTTTQYIATNQSNHNNSNSSNNQRDDRENNSSASDDIGGGSMSFYSGHMRTTTATTSSAAADEVIWATPTSARPPY